MHIENTPEKETALTPSLFSLPETACLCAGSVDLRLGINGFADIIQSRMLASPFEPAVFCFCNKHHNKLKLLFWDGIGFNLVLKRMESGTFAWPRFESQALRIDSSQLRILLEGRDFRDPSKPSRARPRKQWKYV